MERELPRIVLLRRLSTSLSRFFDAQLVWNVFPTVLDIVRL